MPPSMQGGTALVLMKEPTLPAVLPVPGTERGEGGEPSPVHRRRMELHPRLGVTSDASAVLFPILREQPHQRRRDRLFPSLRRRHIFYRFRRHIGLLGTLAVVRISQMRLFNDSGIKFTGQVRRSAPVGRASVGLSRPAAYSHSSPGTWSDTSLPLFDLFHRCSEPP